MKKSILLAIFAILVSGSSISASAQQFIPVRTKKIRVVSNHNIYMGVTGFNFHGSFKYAYEWGTGDNFSLIASAGFRGDIKSVGMEVPALPNKSALRVSPTVSLEPRFYYNFKRRDNFGKSTFLNSGNFISLEASCILPAWYHKTNYITNTYYSAAPRWGLRRVYNDSFCVELHAGFITVFDAVDFFWGPDVGVKIGFAF